MDELNRKETVQTMVHDMRAPMTVLKGNLLLLLSGVVGEMSDDQTLLLRRSIGPLEDLIQMTENILQAANLEREEVKMQPEEADLDQMIAELLDFYQSPFKQREMQLFRQGNSFGTKLLVDGFWVKRVLHNLVWNAYKFTPDGGKVMLHVKHLPGDTFHPEAPTGLQIVVEDTGRGIAPELQKTIFEKFSQAAPQTDRRLGNGLGLWICKRVMQLHGGAIHVESAVGQGCRFILQFPSNRVR